VNISALRSGLGRAVLVLALVTVSTVACAGPGAAPAGSVAPPPAPPVESPIGSGAAGAIRDSPVPSTGCGKSSPVPAGRSTAQTLTSGGVRRDYLLHVPADYDPARPRPLVLSFHGHKRTSAYQEELSGFSATPAIAVSM